MKNTIKILTMVASLLAIILIFTALEAPAEAEPMPEPVYINLEAAKDDEDASLTALSSWHSLELTD